MISACYIQYIKNNICLRTFYIFPHSCIGLHQIWDSGWILHCGSRHSKTCMSSSPRQIFLPNTSSVRERFWNRDNNGIVARIRGKLLLLLPGYERKRKQSSAVAFEALTALKHSIFWDITPCSPLKVNGLRNINPSCHRTGDTVSKHIKYLGTSVN
jgi:hypothetical protein